MGQPQKQIFIGPSEFSIGLIVLTIIFITVVALLFYFNKKEIFIENRKFGIVLVVASIIFYIIMAILLYFGIK